MGHGEASMLETTVTVGIVVSLFAAVRTLITSKPPQLSLGPLIMNWLAAPLREPMEVS